MHNANRMWVLYDKPGESKEDMVDVPINISLLTRKTNALDIKYYAPPYTQPRRTCLMMLDASMTTVSQCSLTNPVKDKKNLIHEMERGVFNCAFDQCKRNNHHPSWDDYRFVKMYNHMAYTMQNIIQQRVDIFDRILRGELDPSTVLKIPIHELMVEQRAVWDKENVRKQQTVQVKVTTD